MDTKKNDLTAETAATPAAEVTTSTAPSDTPVTPEAHAARRQRVENLKKTLVSGSNTETAAQETAPKTTTDTDAPTPAPTADNTSDTTTDTPDTSVTPATLKQPDTATDATDAPDEVITIQVEPMAVEAPGTIAAFLASYLANGYYRGEGKARYPDPALVDHAEMIGKTLAAGGVTPTAFNRMVKTLKGAAKLPLPGQQGAMKKLLPLALKEKKAPPLLREVVERNRAAVQNEADFAACLEHFQDVAIFLVAATQATK